MKKYLFLKDENMLLINFDVLFTDIEIKCLNELNEYGFVKDFQIDLSKRDVKKILYHNMIHGICDEITNNKHKYKKVLIIPPEIRGFHEITEFCDNSKLHDIIYNLTKKLKNILPFVIYSSNDFIFEKDIENTGEFKDFINILSAMTYELENKRYTFEKIKKFSSKFDLKFLSERYFNDIKTKSLLL